MVNSHSYSATSKKHIPSPTPSHHMGSTVEHMSEYDNRVGAEGRVGGGEGSFKFVPSMTPRCTGRVYYDHTEKMCQFEPDL